MGFYVVFQKELDRGKPLPRFQVLHEKPAHDYRVYQLEVGDCIDTANIYFGDDTKTWIRIECYQVKNIGEQPIVEYLETYTMPYVR